MEKRAKLDLSVYVVIGLIYIGLGAIFLVVGLALWGFIREQHSWIFGVAFAGVGMIFLVLGILFLVLENRKKRRIEALIASRRYVWGQIVDFAPNHSVRINGRNPYRAVVRYIDGSGVQHIFYSQNCGYYWDETVFGKQVRVYVEDDRYRHYYVDMEPILPTIVEH